ncbi:transposase [Aminobacter anthyllidis]|uniref:Transposase n=1 Tax=Aminobacter anthyllidis TaxID=1035067 RepID=A0A9X1D4J6_9HYPH|nr:transposase [Aminobacter anthyllidis]
MRLNPANGAMESHSIPDLMLIALAPLVTALEDLAGRIKRLEVEIARWHLADETSRRLETIPGFGVMTASAMSASIADPQCWPRDGSSPHG